MMGQFWHQWFRLVFAAGLAALFTTGCTGLPTDRQFFPIQGQADKAILYIYRARGVVGHGLELDVMLNDSKVATLGVGSVYTRRIEPGHYRLGVVPRRVEGATVLSGVKANQLTDYTLLKLDAQATHTYYVEVEEGIGYVLMESREAEDALAEMAKLIPVE